MPCSQPTFPGYPTQSTIVPERPVRFYRKRPQSHSATPLGPLQRADPTPDIMQSVMRPCTVTRAPPAIASAVESKQREATCDMAERKATAVPFGPTIPTPAYRVLSRHHLQRDGFAPDSQTCDRPVPRLTLDETPQNLSKIEVSSSVGFVNHPRRDSQPDHARPAEVAHVLGRAGRARWRFLRP